MYGKIVDNKLIIATDIIKDGKKTVTRPTNTILQELGYKEIVYTYKPKFDNEEEKLIETFKETDNQILVEYSVEKLTDEEHNEIINNEIREKEELISVGLIATALLNINKGTKDNSAMTEIEKILSEIDSLKKELRGGK